MKNLNSVAVWLVCCLFMLSCEPVQQAEDSASTSNVAIVVLDVSSSAWFDSMAVSKYLEGIVGEHLKHNGDRLVLIYAGHTGFDLTQVRTFAIQAPVDDRNGMNELETIKAEQNMNQLVESEQKRMLSEIRTAMLVERQDSETHLLASLATVEDVLRSFAKQECYLYMFSDFVEDSPIRSFEGVELTSRGEAIEFAEHDLTVLTEKYGLGAYQNGVASVRLVMPNCLGGTMAKRNDQGFVMAYWKEVLSLWSQSVAIDMTCP